VVDAIGKIPALQLCVNAKSGVDIGNISIMQTMNCVQNTSSSSSGNGDTTTPSIPETSDSRTEEKESDVWIAAIVICIIIFLVELFVVVMRKMKLYTYRVNVGIEAL
jgi:beta-lactamase regulating signal transducer with metallopeptidase domain